MADADFVQASMQKMAALFAGLSRDETKQLSPRWSAPAPPSTTVSPKTNRTPTPKPPFLPPPARRSRMRKCWRRRCNRDVPAETKLLQAEP